jgi:hypothetical protein
MNKQMRKMKEEEMRTYEDCLDEYRFWEREVRSIKTFDYPVYSTRLSNTPRKD